MNGIKNEQEEFWAGEFGDEYIEEPDKETKGGIQALPIPNCRR